MQSHMRRFPDHQAHRGAGDEGDESVPQSLASGIPRTDAGQSDDDDGKQHHRQGLHQDQGQRQIRRAKIDEQIGHAQTHPAQAEQRRDA